MMQKVEQGKIYELKPCSRESLANLFCKHVKAISAEKAYDRGAGRYVTTVYYQRMLRSGEFIDEVADTTSELFLEYYQPLHTELPHEKTFEVEIIVRKMILSRGVRDFNSEAAVFRAVKELHDSIFQGGWEKFKKEYCECSVREI
jgi:hypothetical protein